MIFVIIILIALFDLVIVYPTIVVSSRANRLIEEWLIHNQHAKTTTTELKGDSNET